MLYKNIKTTFEIVFWEKHYSYNMNVVKVCKWLYVCRIFIKTVTKVPHRDIVGF